MIIYKYPLSLRDEYMQFNWPKDSKVVHMANQHGQYCMWVEHPVSPDAANSEEIRRFRIYGTGQFIDSRFDYVTTCIDGAFVWHLYEIPIYVKIKDA